MLNKHDVKQSVYIEDIAAIVDGYLEATKTIIQIDGPHHYNADGDLRPAEKLLDAILKKNGYTVFRFKLTKKAFVLKDADVQALLGPFSWGTRCAMWRKY